MTEDSGEINKGRRKLLKDIGLFSAVALTPAAVLGATAVAVERSIPKPIESPSSTKGFRISLSRVKDPSFFKADGDTTLIEDNTELKAQRSQRNGGGEVETGIKLVVVNQGDKKIPGFIIDMETGSQQWLVTDPKHSPEPNPTPIFRITGISSGTILRDTYIRIETTPEGKTVFKSIPVKFQGHSVYDSVDKHP